MTKRPHGGQMVSRRYRFAEYTSRDVQHTSYVMRTVEHVKPVHVKYMSVQRPPGAQAVFPTPRTLARLPRNQGLEGLLMHLGYVRQCVW